MAWYTSEAAGEHAIDVLRVTASPLIGSNVNGEIPPAPSFLFITCNILVLSGDSDNAS